MKRTYIAAALLACTAAPAMAADYYYVAPAANATVVSPAGATVVAPTQYYYQDQAGTISVVQQQLRAEGYSVPINGVFDSRTADALRDFQRGKGIAATGNIDQPTMAALGISSTVAVRSAPVATVPVVVSSATPVIVAPQKAEPLPRNYDGTPGNGLGTSQGFDRRDAKWSANQ